MLQNVYIITSVECLTHITIKLFACTLFHKKYFKFTLVCDDH